MSLRAVATISWIVMGCQPAALPANRPASTATVPQERARQPKPTPTPPTPTLRPIEVTGPPAAAAVPRQLQCKATSDCARDYANFREDGRCCLACGTIVNAQTAARNRRRCEAKPAKHCGKPKCRYDGEPVCWKGRCIGKQQHFPGSTELSGHHWLFDPEAQQKLLFQPDDGGPPFVWLDARLKDEPELEVWLGQNLSATEDAPVMVGEPGVLGLGGETPGTEVERVEAVPYTTGAAVHGCIVKIPTDEGWLLVRYGHEARDEPPSCASAFGHPVLGRLLDQLVLPQRGQRGGRLRPVP